MRVEFSKNKKFKRNRVVESKVERGVSFRQGSPPALGSYRVSLALLIRCVAPA
eukprot:FN607104.1.p1 GENE.FN607104.1~~FN607104.1.p1  ORF type:complete len:53 (+),score=5.09 FN607104.1:135-293(+)